MLLHRGGWPFRFALLLAVFATLLACGEREDAKLLQAAPGLPPDAARHIVFDTQAEFDRYVEGIGHFELERLLSELSTSVLQEDRSDADPSTTVTAALNRVGTALAAHYHYPGALTYATVLTAASPEDRRQIWRLGRECFRIAADSTLSIQAREVLLSSISDSLRALGDDRDATVTSYNRIAFLDNTGHSAQASALARQVVAECDQLGFPSLKCQTLGHLGYLHERAGAVDSAGVYYRRGLDLAERIRHGYQAPRLAHFMSELYRKQGRHALAAEYRELGLDLAERLPAGNASARFILQAMDCYAEYGCWELAERQLPRARAIVNQPIAIKTASFPGESARLAFWEGRQALSRGNLEEGERHFEVARSFARRAGTYGYPEQLEECAETLQRYGYFDRSLGPIDKALSEPITNSHRILTQRLLAHKARALVELDLPEEAGHCLDQLDSTMAVGPPDRTLELPRAALRTRLALLSDQRERAARLLDSALELFADRLVRNDRSAEGYVELSAAEELRGLMHGIAPVVADRTLAVELGWRSVWDLADRASAHPRHAEEVSTTAKLDSRSILEQGNEARIAIEEWVKGNDGVHVLYRVTDDHVMSLITTPDRVEIDTLSASPDRLSALCEWVLARVSEDPSAASLDLGATPPSENAVMASALMDSLQVLSTELLPRPVFDRLAVVRPHDGSPTALRGSSRPALDAVPILFSTDGFLNGFPFVALSSSPARYEPLLARADISFLRSYRVREPIATGPAVVVAAPEISLDSQRRHPNLRRAVDATREIEAVRRSFPTNMVLSGPAATRGAIIEKWEQAPLLYFATHAVRDPEDPYLTFIPLAESAADPRPPMLEVLDIRSADLDRCGLVVLSACGTGAPAHLSQREIAPSLADAFIDSGADAVVEARWPIREQQAQSIMVDFLEGMDAGMTAIQSLNASQRKQLGADGVAVFATTLDPPRESAAARTYRDPFEWAAFAVQLGSLTPIE